MARIRALLLASVALLVGCTAALPPAEPPPPRERIDESVQALSAGEYAAATAELRRISEVCEARELGYTALLLSASADLDPRNPGAVLDRSALLAARVLGDEHAPIWTRPLAETLYLLALHLGATAPDGEVLSAADAWTIHKSDNGANERATPTEEDDSTEGRIDSEEPEEVEEVEEEADGSKDAAAATEQEAEEAGPSRIRRIFGTVRTVGGGAEPEAVEAPDPCGPHSSASMPADSLPDLPGLPIPVRLALLERERERLTRQSEELNVEIRRLEEELERIRRTLIPR